MCSLTYNSVSYTLIPSVILLFRQLYSSLINYIKREVGRRCGCELGARDWEYRGWEYKVFFSNKRFFCKKCLLLKNGFEAGKGFLRRVQENFWWFEIVAVLNPSFWRWNFALNYVYSGTPWCGLNKKFLGNI